MLTFAGAQSAFLAGVVAGTMAFAAAPPGESQPAPAYTCCVRIAGTRVTLGSPAFALTLTGFSVSIEGQSVRIAQARADFSQTSFGGWPVEAAIDGNPQTGWGIHPAEGMRHVAVFELAQPLVCAPGSVLEFRLNHAGRQHSIGRLRLSATGAKPPIPVPPSESQFVVRGMLPTTNSGGTLAVSDAFFHDTSPYWTRDCKKGFTIAGTLAGEPASFEPVVNNGYYRAAWQTWRLAVPSTDAPQPFELSLTTTLPGNVQHRFSAYFVPQDDQQTPRP